RIQIREISPLQQGVVREIHSRHNILRAERHLFGFGKEIVYIIVENHFPDNSNWNLFFGNDFCRVKNIKIKAIGKLIIENLYSQIPFGEIAHVNGVPNITAMKIRVRTIYLDRFIPDN